MNQSLRKSVCRCGKVALAAYGAPIVTTVCHCSGCREAGRILEGLPHASHILDDQEGTPFVLFRKDRVDCISGSELLAEHRLNGSTPTRRVVATCCNSYMFLDFTKGHWITLVRDRLEDASSHRGSTEQKRQAPLFFARLLLAWVAIGFRTPSIDYIKRKIENA